jgi:hypothetical protein
MKAEKQQFSQVHYTHPPLKLKRLFDAIGRPSTFVNKDLDDSHFNPRDFAMEWKFELVADVTFPQNEFELFWEGEEGELSIHMAPSTFEVVRKIHPYVFRNFFAVHGHRFGYFHVAIEAGAPTFENDCLCVGGYFRSKWNGKECASEGYPKKCSKEFECDHLCKYHSTKGDCYSCSRHDKEIYEFDETNKSHRVKKRMRSDD